jgi:cell division septum initiation protein DivIVA
VTAGQTKGAKLVSDAQEQASRLIRDAEEKQRQTLGALQTQRQALENSVEELRAFEREYRSRLKAYLESQLRDLQNRPIAGPAPAGLAPSVGAAPGPGGAAAPQGSGSAPGA